MQLRSAILRRVRLQSRLHHAREIPKEDGHPPPAGAIPFVSVRYASGIMTAPSGRIISGVQLPLPNAPSIMAM